MADDPDAQRTMPTAEACGASGLRAECWIFDVDGSLVDSLTGTSLRPGARALLVHLHEHAGAIIWWSAGGDRYAWQRARQFELDSLVSGFFAKSERDEQGSYRTDHLEVQDRRLVFVDDRPEDLSDEFEVIGVSPYIADNQHDRGLAAAAFRAGLAW